MEVEPESISVGLKQSEDLREQNEKGIIESHL